MFRVIGEFTSYGGGLKTGNVSSGLEILGTASNSAGEPKDILDGSR